MNSESQSDNELLERYVERGDVAAFDAIYRKYAGLVYSVCLRYLRVAQDAEDAVTACFVVLMNKAGTIADRSKLMTWLYSCALKTARNAARLRQHRVEREHKAYDEEIAGKEGRDTDWGDILPNVEIEIERLPVEQREALLLHFYGGLSRSEMAVKLQCPEGTIAARISRGIKTLQKRLRKSGAETSEHTILSGMTGAALILPVPYSVTMKLAAVTKGEAMAGAVMEIVRATMRSFMWAKVKVTALVVGTLAIPTAIAAVAVFGPLHKVDVATMPVATATALAQAEVVYEDNFDGDKLDPFWETLKPASQVAVNPPEHKSRMVLTSAGAEFNRRTGSSYTSLVEVFSKPIVYRTGEVLEVVLEREKALQDQESAKMRPDLPSASESQVGVLNGNNEPLTGTLLASEGEFGERQNPDGTRMFHNPAANQARIVYYFYRTNRVLIIRDSKALLLTCGDDIRAVKLFARQEVNDPLGKWYFPVDRVSVRRLKALPQEMEVRLKAMTGNKEDLRP